MNLSGQIRRFGHTPGWAHMQNLARGSGKDAHTETIKRQNPVQTAESSSLPSVYLGVQDSRSSAVAEGGIARFGQFALDFRDRTETPVRVWVTRPWPTSANSIAGPSMSAGVLARLWRESRRGRCATPRLEARFRLNSGGERW